MINIYEVTETNKMVEKENLDVRTITLGINLLDCASENLDEVNEKGLLKKGDKIVVAGFGGGLTWSAGIIEW